MKKLLVFCCLVFPGLALAQSSEAPSTTLTGYWEGAYLHEGSVQILKMDLQEHEERLHAFFSVPDWGIINAPPRRNELTYSNGQLAFNFLYGPTTLRVDTDAGEMRGTVMRRDSTTHQIHLKRTFRPVEPTLVRENLTFKSGDVTMAGTLVLPEGKGPHPAVIIVQGRGYGSRWGQSAEARRLAERGIAGFVFDGRGVGESGGDRAATTDEDRYQDALGALDLLLARDDIDPNQIGLWGISAGGWVVPVVAQRSGQVAFLILDVGPAESLADQQGHVIEYRMRWFAEEDFTEADYRAAFAYQKKLVELSGEGADWETFEPLVAHARSQPWSQYVDLPDDMTNGELDYFRRRKSFDPLPALRQTTIPVLAFYGERDYVVPPQANVPKLEQALQEAGNTDFKVIVVPNANHGMAIPGGFSEEDGPNRYYRWARGAPGLGDTIYTWILDHVKVDSLP